MLRHRRIQYKNNTFYGKRKRIFGRGMTLRKVIPQIQHCPKLAMQLHRHFQTELHLKLSQN